MDDVLKEATHRQRAEVARVLHGPMAVLADPDMCLGYPRRGYPSDAAIPQASVRSILECLQTLGRADETIYLRSASMNIFNGMVSLTFSWGGSHYMRYDEFLKKNVAFWLGSTA